VNVDKFDIAFYVTIAVIWILVTVSALPTAPPPHDPLLPEPPYSQMRGSR
jgi:hypothetical protein